MTPEQLKAIEKQADRWSDLACDIQCDALGTAAEDTIPALIAALKDERAARAAELEAAFKEGAYHMEHNDKLWSVEEWWYHSAAHRKLEAKP